MEAIFGTIAGAVIIILMVLCDYFERECIRLRRDNKDKGRVIEELSNARNRM